MAKRIDPGVADASHWTDVFDRQFKKETDRACVILSAAMLDVALETLLKARLVPLASAKDDLLEGAHGPISDFSARIDLAHRIGLISTKFCRDLHLIRRIRNDFAHNITGCSFKDSNVRNRVVELARSSTVIDDMPDIRRKNFPDGPRGDFQMSVSWMLWRLRTMAHEVSSIKQAGLEWGYMREAAPRRVSKRKPEAKKSRDTGSQSPKR
jgi:DNA-binding MltR family transcriptional regulator